MIAIVSKGSFWRHRMIVLKGEDAPETFITDRLGRDGRVGTVLVQVDDLHPKGQRVKVHRVGEPTCEGCGKHHNTLEVAVEELLELREGDERWLKGRSTAVTDGA